MHEGAAQQSFYEIERVLAASKAAKLAPHRVPLRARKAGPLCDRCLSRLLKRGGMLISRAKPASVSPIISARDAKDQRSIPRYPSQKTTLPETQLRQDKPPDVGNDPRAIQQRLDVVKNDLQALDRTRLSRAEKLSRWHELLEEKFALQEKLDSLEENA
jgi:hypothetical protein